MNTVTKPRLWSVITLLVVLTLPGCISDYAPQELLTANKYQAQALDGAIANRQKIVDAYTAELLSAYRLQMDLITTLALANALVVDGTGTEMVPVAIVQKVNTERAKREREIEGELAKKAAEFMADENFAVAQELNAKVGQWLQKYVGDFAGKIDEIIQLGKRVVEPEDE